MLMMELSVQKSWESSFKEKGIMAMRNAKTPLGKQNWHLSLCAVAVNEVT